MVNLKFEIVWGWVFSIDIFIIVLGNHSFTSEFSDLVVTFFCLRRKNKKNLPKYSSEWNVGGLGCRSRAVQT